RLRLPRAWIGTRRRPATGDHRDALSARLPPDPGRHDRRGRPDRRGAGAISGSGCLANGDPGTCRIARPGSRPEPGTAGLAGIKSVGQPHFVREPLACPVSAAGRGAKPGHAAPGSADRRSLRRAGHAGGQKGRDHQGQRQLGCG
ncbi:hypothetical protein KXW38_000949, partial [Aspergillus fumigatus]